MLHGSPTQPYSNSKEVNSQMERLVKKKWKSRVGEAKYLQDAWRLIETTITEVQLECTTDGRNYGKMAGLTNGVEVIKSRKASFSMLCLNERRQDVNETSTVSK